MTSAALLDFPKNEEMYKLNYDTKETQLTGQEMAMFYTVAYNQLLRYLKEVRALFKVDIAIKSFSGVEIYSVKDSALKNLATKNKGYEVIADIDSIDMRIYGIDAVDDDIKILFKNQEKNDQWLQVRTLLNDPIVIESRNSNMKIYAGLLACGRSIKNRETHKFLLQSLIKFLNNKHIELDTLYLDKNYQEIAKDAFVRFLAQKVYGRINDERNNEFYETCCLLACTPYETMQNHGRIGILTEGVAEREAFIQFDLPVAVEKHNVRQIRKLLEMSDEHGSLLIMEQGEIKGIYTPQTRYNGSGVLFGGNGKWHFFTDGNKPLISFEANSFDLKAANHDNVEQQLQRVFCDSIDIHAIKDILKTAQRQKHGTTIIISDHAEEESVRLSSLNRAIKVSAKLNKREAIKSVTAIDGAILLDPSGKCFAIGAILDGEAYKPGNSARGARYNSAVTYIDYWEKKGYKAVAIIISVDDSINVYPEIDDYDC